MLTFDELSTAQKKWVYLVEHFHPEVKDEVSFKQINEFHSEFMSLREKNKKNKGGCFFIIPITFSDNNTHTNVLHYIIRVLSSIDFLYLYSPR